MKELSNGFVLVKKMMKKAMQCFPSFLLYQGQPATWHGDSRGDVGRPDGHWDEEYLRPQLSPPDPQCKVSSCLHAAHESGDDET